MSNPSTTDIDIASRALVLIGAEQITSFSDQSTQAQVASALYEDVVRDLLSLYRWRFSAKTARLSRKATAPDHQWDAAYEIPTDSLALHGVFVNDSPIAYDVFGDEVVCNASNNDAVYANYTQRQNEAEWPGYFVTLVQFKLASMFALAIASNEEMANAFEKLFEKQRARARSMDSQQQTNRRMGSGLFIRVRD